MLEAQLSNPRKRRHSEQPTLQQNEASQHACKRRKRSHLSGSQFLPAFWDNLSKIDLTKRALKELDRRNTRATLNARQPYLRPDQRITRCGFAELKKNSQPLKPLAEYLRCCKTSDLKNIKQTARHGGPDLSDLRSFPEHSSPLKPTTSLTRSKSRASKRPARPTSRYDPSTNVTKTASTNPHNRNFQQHLVDSGVYPHGYRYPDGRVPAKPDNWEEINQILSRPRPSLSPSGFSDEAHEKFVQADADAAKETQVTTSVIPIIQGDIKDARCVSGGIPFKNLVPLTDAKLAPGNPDIYYGGRPEQLHRQVRDELSGYIIPSTQDDLPIAPNFLLAVKGPDGSLAVASRQASYDGALGARGMHRLQSYRQEEPVFDNTASTISSIYHGGLLKMFTIHPSQPTNIGSRAEYIMHEVKGWYMRSDPETFRQGATFYRNAMDWAKEHRDMAIRRANERVDEGRAGTLAVDTSFAQASSFVGEATSEVTTIEALTEETQTTRTEKLKTSTQTFGTSSGEPSVDHRVSVKRSREPAETPRPKRKRLNAGKSDYDLSQQSGLQQSGCSGPSQRFGNQDLEREADCQSSRDDLQ